MIFAENITGLKKYCNDNREDKTSDKPYFIIDEVDGGYSIPKDPLIEAGLKELGLDYSILIEVNGLWFEFESTIFNEL